MPQQILCGCICAQHWSQTPPLLGTEYYRLLFPSFMNAALFYSGPSPAQSPRAELEKHSRWSRSRCRVFAASRAGPGPPGCQTHYCLWSWRWPCLPDLRQGEQHRQESADKSVTTGNTLLQHYDSVWLNNNIDVKLPCVFVCVRTLPCDYNTRHAVWDAGACCEEGDAHDDVGNSQSEADHSHLNPKTDFASIDSFIWSWAVELIKWHIFPIWNSITKQSFIKT